MSNFINVGFESPIGVAWRDGAQVTWKENGLTDLVANRSNILKGCIIPMIRPAYGKEINLPLSVECIGKETWILDLGRPS